MAASGFYFDPSTWSFDFDKEYGHIQLKAKIIEIRLTGPRNQLLNSFMEFVRKSDYKVEKPDV